MKSISFMWRGIAPVIALAINRAVLLGLMLFTASGCGVLPEVNEPLRLYTLTPKTTFDGTLPKVDWQLVVELPNAAAGLDTSRVALARSP
jgi:cholesterol transport system auxiliary component